jgi:membrane fusion protein (multidrug efflux system)
MQIQFEETQWRRTDRLNLPAQVGIDGKVYSVVDWSYAGFAIFAENWQGAADAQLHAEFILPFGHFKANLDIDAVVRWIRADQVGFEFVALPHQARLMMRDYVEECVSGKLDPTATASGNRDSAHLQTMKAQPSPVAPPAVSLSGTPSRFKRSVGMYAVISILVLGLGSVMVMARRYVYSVDAVVTGNVLEVRAKADGVIADIRVKEGQRIEAGTLLVQLDDREQRSRLAETAYLFQKQQSIVERAQAFVDKERANLKLYGRVADYRAQTENKRLAEADAARKLAQIDVDRAEALREPGFVSLATVEEKRAIHAQRQAAYERVVSESGMAHDIAKEAKAGRFFSRDRVDNDLAQADVALNMHRFLLEKITMDIGPLRDGIDRMAVTAPDDGIVRVLTRSKGELVKTGDDLLLLETGGRPSVIARFLARDALLIAQGQAVDLYFPSINQQVKGTVESIGHQGAGNAMPNTSGQEAGPTVPVRIRLDSGVKDLPGGIRADAAVDTERIWFSWIYRILSR